MTTPAPNPFDDPALASSYDHWFDLSVGQVADRLEMALIYRLTQPRPGEKALDVGTGTGHFACDLAARGLHVVGYDRSEAMLAVARAKAACGVIWQQGEAEALPFADGAFDLVLSVAALDFMSDRERALAEMVRVVAPGGRLVVAVLNGHSAWGQQQPGTPYATLRFFTPPEFVATLARYGQVHWNSSVFFPPSGAGIGLAGLWERFGQMLYRSGGALLVGRIDR